MSAFEDTRVSGVAVVTGASRGVGRGIATALAASGFAVFGTGRSIATAELPDSVIRMPCDHLDDAQTAAAFARVTSERGRLDILVNSSWGGYERMVEDGNFTWTAPFYRQPPYRWRAMMDAGVRSAFVCAQHAAPVMIAQGSGLIVNLSFWAAQKYVGNVVYGVSKAATDKMTADIAYELRSQNVAAVSLYPGLVRTEAVLAAAREGWLDLSNSESPEFSGRVIAALYNDPNLMSYSGKVIVAAEAAKRYSIRDTDGREPAPITLESV